ncbi:MAG: hypothetical protein LBL35_02020 [Clostridiales bacterium]|nr:hypothetical protein [Clostridiales bacterium]
MDNKVKKSIEELKNAVLDLHRSAGQLDSVIQYIENEEEDASEKEYWKMFIKVQANYRREVKTRYGDLDEKENEIWKKLTIEMEKDES